MKLSHTLIIGAIFALSGCKPVASPDDQVASVIAKFSEQADIDYQQARVDLNNDGIDDVLVLLQGQEWCGSGGCTFLVLEGLKGSGEGGLTAYKILSQSTVTRPPIRVSERANEGWKNLIVYSDGEERLLAFDGKRYPPNPSLESVASAEEREQAVLVLP